MKKPSKPLHARGELRCADPGVSPSCLPSISFCGSSFLRRSCRPSSGRNMKARLCACWCCFCSCSRFSSRKTSASALPSTLEIIILLFIFAAEILGELQSYFIQYPYWDTMLHTTNGFLCAAVGFSLIDILNRDAKIKFHALARVCGAGRVLFFDDDRCSVGVL